MGYTTDFIGHIEVKPTLNEAEQLYLTAFGQSRRCGRPNGPYEIPTNPAAERSQHRADVEGYNTIAPGQPSLRCGWTPCWDGCCLAHDGTEKCYASTSWIQYLIDHFLAPNAVAATSGLTWFEDFSFDHVLNGTIAACRRDTRELYLIRVERNVVTEDTITLPDPQFFDVDPLPYEITIDEQTERSRRRNPRRPRRLG